MNDKPEVLKETNKIYTHKHIVSHYINLAVKELANRGIDHDNSKLTPEELEGYVNYGPILDKAVIGTDEYNETLELMKKYNEIHYSRNRHHPEFFDNGVDDMNLIDILEMFCDWCAKSDEKNTNVIDIMDEVLLNRFGIDEQLGKVLKNTLRYLQSLSGDM